MAMSLASLIRRTIQEHKMLSAGDRVGVAVSGGADSVALLLLLLEIRELLGIVLSVAHFNHKLRGKSSDADERFVAELAARHQLEFHIERADIAAQAKRDKANLEDTARRSRYAFFSKLIANGLLTRVAVAHTQDDQAETVLAHILRGTGLTGLAGIHPQTAQVVRPLLQFRRASLRAYLQSCRQRWREDATNRDTTRLRARIRKQLLPLLEKKFQPAVIVHLCTLAALAREDAALLDSAAEQQAETFCEFLPEAVHMDVATLLGGPEPKSRVAAPAGAAANAAMAKRVVRTIVRKLKPRAGQLTSQHVAAILKLAEHGKPGKYLPLPGGLQVHREHATLVFSISPPRQRSSSSVSRNFEQPIDLGLASGGATVGVEVPLPHLGCVFRFTTIDWPTERRETSPTGAVLDRDVLRSPLVLRNWRPGDVFQPAGHRRAHKMKRLLNQHRISGWERDGWPVLTSGGVLVWARGFPAARAFAASERTQAGIVIAEEKLP